MANTVEKLRGLILSAEELKSLESWNSATIEEWLNFFDNLILLAESVDDSSTVSNQPKSANLAKINEINDRLGSGEPFSWDDTGFTWDSTKITFDKTEYD